MMTSKMMYIANMALGRILTLGSSTMQQITNTNTSSNNLSWGEFVF